MLGFSYQIQTLQKSVQEPRTTSRYFFTPVLHIEVYTEEMFLKVISLKLFIQNEAFTSVEASSRNRYAVTGPIERVAVSF